jgi:Uma2 family endonuclease
MSSLNNRFGGAPAAQVKAQQRLSLRVQETQARLLAADLVAAHVTGVGINHVVQTQLRSLSSLEEQSRLCESFVEPHVRQTRFELLEALSGRSSLRVGSPGGLRELDSMTITLDVSAFGPVTDDSFFDFCQSHDNLRIERTATGEIIVMPPAGGESSNQNFTLTARFARWSEQDGRGVAFDSSAGFRLPNGAVRGPDLAWVRAERWEALTPEQRRKFPPLCPDFVVELVSPSDELREVRAKMQEYIDNGISLGWLLDPLRGRAEIYRPGRPVEILERPARLSCEGVLPGLDLDLAGIL